MRTLQNNNDGHDRRVVQEDYDLIETPAATAIIQKNPVKMMWQHRWIILLVTIATLAVAFLYIMKATPIFTSTSRIYVEQRGPKIVANYEGVLTQSKNYIYTQAELLKSTPILQSTLEKPGIKGMKVFEKVDNHIIYLKKKGLDVEVGKKDDIISISSDSPEPAEAAKLVNAVIDSYITHQSAQKRDTSSEILKILQNEKLKRDAELAEKLQAMMDFKKENVALAFENRSGNIILDRLAQLSNAMTLAQLQTIEYKSLYEVTKSMVDDPVMIMQLAEAERANQVYVAADEKNQLSVELNQLQQQMTDLTGQVPDDHPAAKVLREKAEQIKGKINEIDIKFAKAQLAIVEKKYTASKEGEEQVRLYFEDQRQQALDLNNQLAQYTVLQSDWEQTKKLCDILDDRIKELAVTEEAGALNITILEVARPAAKPSKPQKARIMAIAFILGFMLSFGIVLVKESMDTRLHSAEEIISVLEVPVLGSVPTMSKKNSISERGQKVHLEPSSPIAEAYRTIRTAVFFGVPEGEAKTILVTSPDPGDGKTTLVSNLAIAIAQTSQKTLIIDADFRKPMQHNVFEVTNESGLSSALTNRSTLDEAARSTSIKYLDLMSTGPDVPNPSEMLNSSTFRKILEALSARYDRIVIDSPPVMPVTDTQILAAFCNVTLLVLKADKSTRKVSQQARDGLLSVGARLLGVVVNATNRKNGNYGYSSGYGYYGYGRYGHKTSEKEKVS
ncbi:GumC family protein [Planctomycetota bacterium]